MLIFETDDEVDDLQDKKWFCEMNQDRSHSKCKTPEKDTEWYSANMRRLISLKARQENESNTNNQATSLDAVVPLSDPIKDAAILEKTKQMIENDIILKKLGTLQLFDNRSLNETTVSSAEEPNKSKSMASKLFGKIYFPDLLSTHSTKDLDAAASYQKSLEEKAIAEIKSVRDHDAAASHLQSLEDKQMLISPSGVGDWDMDATEQRDKPESELRTQQTAANKANVTSSTNGHAKVMAPAMSQSNNHEPSNSNTLMKKPSTANIGMRGPLVANKALDTNGSIHHSLAAHVIAIDATYRQSRGAVTEETNNRGTQKQVLMKIPAREVEGHMQLLKLKTSSKGGWGVKPTANDTTSIGGPILSKNPVGLCKGHVKLEKKEGVRSWGTEEEPLEILSDSDC